MEQRTGGQVGDRFKIQFARRKQAAKMLVCPPELQIGRKRRVGRLTDKEVVEASKGALSEDLHAFDPEGHCAKIRRGEGACKEARMQNANPGGRARVRTDEGHGHARTDISHLVPAYLVA